MKARTKRIVISITPAEKSLLVKLAGYEGRLSLTGTVRHILIEASRNRGLTADNAQNTKDYKKESKLN